MCVYVCCVHLAVCVCMCVWQAQASSGVVHVGIIQACGTHTHTHTYTHKMNATWCKQIYECNLMCICVYAHARVLQAQAGRDIVRVRLIRTICVGLARTIYIYTVNEVFLAGK
jgi:hypothetical protein